MNLDGFLEGRDVFWYTAPPAIACFALGFVLLFSLAVDRGPRDLFYSLPSYGLIETFVVMGLGWVFLAAGIYLDSRSGGDSA